MWTSELLLLPLLLITGGRGVERHVIPRSNFQLYHCTLQLSGVLPSLLRGDYHVRLRGRLRSSTRLRIDNASI